MTNKDSERRRVLVAWGSKRGGTEGIARMVGAELTAAGYDVDLYPASKVKGLRNYDAVVIGGALYANRWHRHARRFVLRHRRALCRVPVWMFSSGPLDDSATEGTIAPTRQVDMLMKLVGGLGHATFGGRLRPDATGFPAGAMAKKHAGDYRDPKQVKAWAARVAEALPTARPGVVVHLRGRSGLRLASHAVFGWAACAAIMAALLQFTSAGTAVVVHAIAAPLVFAAVALNYFRAPGARSPLPVALAFTAATAALDAGVVAALLMGSFAMFESVTGTWLPMALIFLVTWMVGAMVSMVPTSSPPRGASAAPRPSGA